MKTSKIGYILIIILLVFSVILFLSYYSSISRVKVDEKIIFLTFDDAPSLNTLEVLKILKERNVSATFFLIGYNAIIYPEVIDQIKKENHNIGIHSMSHSSLYKNISEELLMSKSILDEQFNKSIYLFRPPFAISTPFLMYETNKLGLKMILWDVFPKDYKKNSTQILSYIINNTRDGSIIVLHDSPGNKSEMLNSLDEIIVLLEEKGFSFGLLEDYVVEK